MLHETIKTEAIILQEKEIGESDKLFFLYTEGFGKIEILGKSIRKSKAKLRGGLQVLNYISVEFVKGKKFNITTDVIIKKEFSKIKKNPRAFKEAIYLCGLLNKLTEPEEKDERIWNLLKDSLDDLERLIESNYWFPVRYFEWNLLSFLGFEPEIYKCVECRDKIKYGKFFFSSKKGGVLCERCIKNKENPPREISRDAIKILRLIINRDKELLKRIKINKEQESEIKRLSLYYIRNILQDSVFVI